MPEAEAPDTGMLYFLGHPVFKALGWQEEGQWRLQPLELDLVAVAPDRDQAAEKLGEMILDLYAVLKDEVGDRTDTDDEIVALVQERLVGAVLAHHRERRRQRIIEAAKSLFQSQAKDWKVGPASDQALPEPALSG